MEDCISSLHDEFVAVGIKKEVFVPFRQSVELKGNCDADRFCIFVYRFNNELSPRVSSGQYFQSLRGR